MPRVWKSRGAGNPSPSNPIMVRWIATVDTGSTLYADPSVFHMWRPYLDPTTTMEQLIEATMLFAREHKARCPRSRGCLAPHGIASRGPLGQLFLQFLDQPGTTPFASPGNVTLYTAAGRADVAPKVADYLDQLFPRLLAEGIEPPGMFHLDIEPGQDAGGSQLAADALAGVPKGYYSPCVSDPRGNSQTVWDALTVANIDAIRASEGYTFDNTKTGYSAENRFFNTEFIGSLPIQSWAISRAIYDAISARVDATTSNFDHYAAFRSASAPIARDHFNPQIYQYPQRHNYATHHAPALYPFSIVNGASLVLPGETNADFFVRLNAEYLDAIVSGPQPSKPIVPWISEPGVLGDGSGWVTDEDATFRIMKEAHARGAVVFIMWGDDNLDPHAAAVESVWSQFRLWARSQ